MAKVLQHLSAQGRIDVDFAPVDPDTCEVTPAAVLALLRPTTCLVSIMLANNETGVLQPVADIFRQVLAANPVRRPLLHTDAAQVFLGKKKKKKKKKKRKKKRKRERKGESDVSVIAH